MAQNERAGNIGRGPVYYVRDWCSTPGYLDDTCFSNVIAYVLAQGKMAFAGHRYAELIVSPEVYVFRKTVVLPVGLNLGIHGSFESGVYGSTIETGLEAVGMPGSVDDFLVLSDNVDIKNLSFIQTSDVKRQAIVLGSASVVVYDTHINWCWFAGQSVAIHAVNTSGLDLSHNTFDSGTDFGILTDATRGDVSATAIIANDLRGYSNRSSVSLTGDGSSRFSDVTLSGIFDRSISESAAVAMAKMISVRVQGTFVDNRSFDVMMKNVKGGTIGPFISRGNEFESIRIEASQNVSVLDGNILDQGSTSSEPLAAVEISSSKGTRIHDVTSGETENGKGTKAAYGLSIDAASSGSILYGNVWMNQRTNADRILDTTATVPVEGLRVAGSVRNATGLQHRRFAVNCTTAPAPLSTCTSALLLWDVPFADSSYTATCTLEVTMGTPILASLAKQPTGLLLKIANLKAGAATGTANCIAFHD